MGLSLDTSQSTWSFLILESGVGTFLSSLFLGHFLSQVKGPLFSLSFQEQSWMSEKWDEDSRRGYHLWAWQGHQVPLDQGLSLFHKEVAESVGGDDVN